MNTFLQRSNNTTPFQYRLSNMPGITMSVLYKGLVLSELIQPLHLGHDYGVFQASGQNYLTGIKEIVYLHGTEDPQTIRARIDEVNPKRAWITLSHFTPLQTKWQDRQEDRVQPARPIQVRLYHSGKLVSGSLNNLSVQGLGVLLYHMQEKGSKLDIGSRVRVEIPILYGFTPVKMDAHIQSIRFVGTNQVILGLQANPNRKQLLTLRQYIEYRKNEIYSELNTVKFARLEPRSTKDLFF